MKKEIILASLGLIILVVGGVMVMRQKVIYRENIEITNLNSQIISLGSKIVEHTERLENCKEFSLFKQATIKVGSRTWNEESYNCVAFSKDLARELKELGIKSSIAIAEERTHAFVLVWLEATTGNFVNPDSELEILEIRDDEMKVICN